MATLTKAQTDAINTAIDAVQTYVDSLQDALTDAANAGKGGIATQIESRFLDANSLEERLVGLLTISDLGSLQSAIQSVTLITKTLASQKESIDTLVKAVGTVATIIADITSIAAAVAKLGL